nr:MAG TPA_asm: hypothetical protein [Caudoviricetes sp.]
MKPGRSIQNKRYKSKNYPWMTAFVLITLSRRINPAKNLSALYPGNDLRVT